MTHLNRLCNKTFKTSFQAAWRRKWQPTPVFLPGESQGHGSVVGCRLWGPQSQTRVKRLRSSSRLVFFLHAIFPGTRHTGVEMLMTE